MIEVIGASKAKNIEDLPLKMSEIFVQSFGEHFTFFSKAPQKQILAFQHIFDLDCFHVALLDGEVVGIGAITPSRLHSVDLKIKPLLTNFGMIKGLFAYVLLNKEFKKTSKLLGDEIATIEFIATKPGFRKMGIGKTIVQHLIDNSPHKKLILEVADTNRPAIELYEKLGFKEFQRVEEKHAQTSGINFLIYMLLDRS